MIRKTKQKVAEPQKKLRAENKVDRKNEKHKTERSTILSVRLKR